MKKPKEPSRTDSHNIFNSIALRYDVFNTVASLGIDKYWRKKLAEKLRGKKNLKILDAATGTAELLIAVLKSGCQITSAVGIDMSEQMLRLAEQKILRYKFAAQVLLKQADAANLPFENNSFDAVVCAFGVRNFSNPSAGLEQFFRVLNAGGKVLILEFSLPENRILKWGSLLYLKYAIPLIGKAVTGDRNAYKYLSETIQTFAYGDEFRDMMAKAGFVNIEAQPLSFGITTLYIAEKPA